jgi:cytoskeletal protein CcmA (bactofilin family)
MSGSNTVFSRGEYPLRADKLNQAFSERVLRTGDDMSGPLTLPANPVRQSEASNKEYVDQKTIDLQFALLSDLASGLGGGPGTSVVIDGTLTVNGDGSVSGNFTVVGNIVADGDISSHKNVTAEAAVIGSRIFAFDPTHNGLGGVVGSWNVDTLKGAGFRYSDNYAVPTMEFGAVDPATGTMPYVVMTLSNSGDFGIVGSASLAHNLAVGDNAIIGKILNVLGASILHGKLSVQNAAGGEVFTVSSTTGDVALAGSLAIGGNAVVAGSETVNNNLTVGGSAVIGDNLAIAHSVTVGQFLNVANGMRLNGLSPYPGNGAAIAAGHVTGDLYFNSTVNALSVVVGNP